MNVLIVGGSGSFVDNISIKESKEGEKVSILTGNRFSDKHDYQKYFELYNFPYNSVSINEVFESAAPDVTIFMGAYDTNFKWKNEEADAVKYTSSLANILMGYAMRGKGKFIYLSSQEIFGYGDDELIQAGTIAYPTNYKGQAILQGEDMCESYRINRNLDITVVRCDNVFSIPHDKKDVCDIVNRMCYDALAYNEIRYSKDKYFSLLFVRDAVEALHSIIKCDSLIFKTYQLSSQRIISEQELAEIIRDKFSTDVDLVAVAAKDSSQTVLSSQTYENQFGTLFTKELEDNVSRIVKTMERDSYLFLTEEVSDIKLVQKLKQKGGWFIRAVIPFLENIIVFLLCYFIYPKAANSNYFANLDIFLLYVLLFAVVFGQQQATFSAILAALGFIFKSAGNLSALIDGNTYVWIAQLFVVGLPIGYMRDQIVKLKKEQEEERDFLEQQIEDIQDINSTNSRVKDVLETQLVNQSDSLGKVYRITSALEQYSPEEVLFYSAETVGKIMKTEDVAIYLVTNESYARLFSSTSKAARIYGTSIKYKEMGEMYQTLSEHKVFINRKMDKNFPLMANAIFSDGNMEIIIMVWGLSWENMTLGQSNQLVIVSALIQNAVLRSSNYLSTLADKRYIEGSRALAPESFEALVNAFLKAKEKGLSNCTLLRFSSDRLSNSQMQIAVQDGIRMSDYFGCDKDGVWYSLLSNTEEDAAGLVIGRFAEKGIKAEIIREFGI